MAKVLLIEDDSIVVNIYSTYLHNHGHEAKAVEEGSKAVEEALKFKPDLILLDLMVPKIGGAKILAELRSKAEFKKIPIIVYTNLDSEDKKNEVLQSGATEFFSKAKTNHKEVIGKIEQYLQR